MKSPPTRCRPADHASWTGITVVRHPVVGELHLQRNRLAVPHSGGQHIIIFSAAAGTASAAALQRLSAMAGT